MTNLPAIDDLSYTCIDIKPIDYQFAGERWSEATEDGTGWRVLDGSIIPEDLELEIEVDGITLTLDDDNYEITDNALNTRTPEDDKYDDWAEKFKLDPDEIRRHLDGEDHDDWTPVMNYAYPLDREPPDDWKTRTSCCTCVEIDGSYFLALTGGGMDFSWEICETYMRLGYYPPAHFANLPAMAGRGTSERDKWIISGCRKSLEGMRDRATRALEGLDTLTE